MHQAEGILPPPEIQACKSCWIETDLILYSKYGNSNVPTAWCQLEELQSALEHLPLQIRTVALREPSGPKVVQLRLVLCKGQHVNRLLICP